MHADPAKIERIRLLWDPWGDPLFENMGPLPKKKKKKKKKVVSQRTLPRLMVLSSCAMTVIQQTPDLKYQNS